MIFTYPNTHTVLKSEAIAKEAGVAVTIIPVPRHISADCTMGMRIEDCDAKTLHQLLEQQGVEHQMHGE